MGEHTRIFLDIETIPSQAEGAAERARERIKPPKNYKDPEKIEAYINEKAEEAYLQTSLDGSYGELFCIGFALGDEPAQVVYRDFESTSEKDLLDSFWDILGSDLSVGATWVGHNVLRFDLRFIWQRSVIHRVRMPHRMPFDASPWSSEVGDTMLMWTGERNSYVSLDELLAILGIESKDAMSGADVWPYIIAGKEDEVIRHCLRNVEEVREAYNRMLLQ